MPSVCEHKTWQVAALDPTGRAGLSSALCSGDDLLGTATTCSKGRDRWTLMSGHPLDTMVAS